MKRAFFIDHLRVLLTMLVIFHHVAIAYGGPGSWYYVSPGVMGEAGRGVLSVILAVNQAFFMSFFFFISAFLMPHSYDKKGFSRFLKDRLIRLGIPLVVYVVLINPNLNYFIQKALLKETGDWVDFVWNGIVRHPGTGPLWFVLALLVFELLYALWRRFMKGWWLQVSGRKAEWLPKVPSHGMILLSILFCGALAFSVRLFYPAGKSFLGLQWGYFVLYVAMFLMGIVAFRGRWTEFFPLKKARVWFRVALGMIVFLMLVTFFLGESSQSSLFMGGMNYPALTYALWEPFICVGFCAYLFLWFKSRFVSAGGFLMNLSADSYTVFIIHSVVVVGMTFLLESFPVSPFMKCMLNFGLSVVFCYVLAHWLREIPGVKRVL